MTVYAEVTSVSLGRLVAELFNLKNGCLEVFAFTKVLALVVSTDIIMVFKWTFSWRRLFTLIRLLTCLQRCFYSVGQGCHGRQGSQGLILGWILRNRKRWQHLRRTNEVVATMASLPAKNLPLRHCWGLTYTLSNPKSSLMVISNKLWQRDIVYGWSL